MQICKGGIIMRKDREKLVSEWLERLQQQSNSGKSIAEWCQEQAISYHTFLYWRKQLRPVKTKTPMECSFVELPKETSEKTWIEITLEGAKIQITKNFDRGALLFCLKVLGGH
jgi:hypothetical protein